MADSILLAAAFGAVAGAAVWAAIAFAAAVRRRAAGAGDDRPGPATPGRGPVRGRRARMVAAVAAGAGVWAVTAWPVAGAGAAALAWWGPAVFGGERAHRERLARVNAVAAWTGSLRDVLTAAAGLEQAIQRSADHPPPAIRDEVQGLAADLRSGRDLDTALGDFAQKLNNEVGDAVAMALRTAAARAGNLAAVLDELAAQARDDALMWMRVHTARARVRTATRVIGGTTVVMLGGLLVFSTDYLAAYATATGQVVLAMVLGLFGWALWWLHRLAIPPTAPSFLHPDVREARS